MRPLRSLLVALLGLLVLAGPATAAHAPGTKRQQQLLKPVTGPLKARIGIADQKAEVFSDPRFRGLRLTTARRSVAWDAMRYDWQVADVDAWMAGARAARISPVITFARSRIDARRHAVPTVAQMRAAFVAFRRRYPWATDFVASNESNHFGEPTGRRPKLAAQYYRAMRSACPRCRIAAATLVDYPNLVKWSKAFVEAAGERPRHWALHNYISANRFDLTRTREFLLATKGEVWITEVGGAVKRARGQAKFGEGTAHAARVTRYIFDHLARASSRITRVYLYHWSSVGPGSSWDSGLVGADGRPRPAFTVFERQLRRRRAQAPAKGKAKPEKGKRERLPIVEGTLPTR